MVKYSFGFIIITCLLYFFDNISLSANQLIVNGTVEGIKIGDTAEKIFGTFKSNYRISDEKKPHYVRVITVHKNNQRVIEFEVDDQDHILMIYIYRDYVTQEKIGCGSTLSEAIRIYGKGNIAPSDQGYLIFFQKIKGIAFLLNDLDIPKELRNIPDDVFTSAQENKILSLSSKIKISAIELSGIEE